MYIIIIVCLVKDLRVKFFNILLGYSIKRLGVHIQYLTFDFRLLDEDPGVMNVIITQKFLSAHLYKGAVRTHPLALFCA